jgi:outer membrane receptor protein involved in Fe transport
LQIDHRWRNFEINAIFSHSYSENSIPLEIRSTNSNSPVNPFPTNRDAEFNADLDPETIPDSLRISKDEAVQFMHLGQMYHDESETLERDLTAELNLAYNLNFSDNINVKFNIGTKLKYKTKEYDNQSFNMSGQYYLNLVYETFEDELSERNKEAWAADNMRIFLIDFLDDDYKGTDFLDGRYNFGRVMDKDDFRRIDELVMATYDPNSTSISLWDLVAENFIDSRFQDFNGKEDYFAAYFMPEIKIGNSLLLVPGLRYESNRTDYTGYRGTRLGVLRDWQPTPVDTVAKVRKNDFLLPMVQLFYKPTDWLTIKAGYTHTLQRPDYNNIMPGWVISNQGQIYNLSNFRLKPEKSRNLDLQLSLHSNKLGLISAGAFYKKITDMILL